MAYGISEVGGAELYVMNKVRWLKSNGWDTHVITAGYKNDKYISRLFKFNKHRFNKF